MTVLSTVSVTQEKKFAALFSGHPSVYGQMHVREDGTKNAQTVRAPLPEGIYGKHLRGDGPFLGMPPLRPDEMCYFGAIDYDNDEADLHHLEAEVERLQLPLVVCRSKSGGAHLFCFGKELLPAGPLVAALTRMRKLLKVEKNPDGKGVEIFPKQIKLTDKGSGNWINLPYYHHSETNRYAVFAGEQLTLDEFLTHALKRAITTEMLDGIGNPGTGTFADGPPCLEKLDADGFAKGSRNTFLFNAAQFFVLKFRDDWQNRLIAYNNRAASPLPRNEVFGLIGSVEKSDYQYQCGIEPLHSLCEQKKCQHRAFGTSKQKSAARLASLPALMNLVKVLTEPPRYRLTVGETEITLASEQLQQSHLFKAALFEQLNLVIQLPKPNEWDDILKDLIAGMTEEKAPAEAGDRGLLLMFLMDFLLLRTKAQDVADILRGLPWADPADGRVYFRGADFAGFLQRRGFKKFEMNELYTILTENADLTFTEKLIKGNDAKLWSVPTPAGEQTESFDYVEPKVKAPV